MISLSSDFSNESEYENLVKYEGYFDKNYRFGCRKTSLEESTNLNDIPLKIADMLISGGYFRVADVKQASLTYEKAVAINPLYSTGYYPKFRVTKENLFEMKEYDAHQALWDFAYAREFVVNKNTISLMPPYPDLRYYAPYDNGDSIEGYINDEDNADVETIYAELVNADFYSSITYDGDYQKILDYNLAFSHDVNRTEAIKAIMEEAVSAAETLAMRKPSSNPFYFESFEFVLVDTPQGAWTQMPVLPEIKGDE